MNEIDKILKNFEAADAFNSKLPAIEKKMLEELFVLLKDLEISNGRIKSNIANLKHVNGIKNKFERLIVSKLYLKDLIEYVKSFNTAAMYATAYYKEMSDKFKPKSYYDLIRDTAVRNATENLTKVGIAANVVTPLRNTLITAITSSQNYTSLLESLKDNIVSSNDNIGSLSRFAGTYSVTALSQFTGQYIAAINRDLGFNWYRYVGSNIKTTREFCLLMTEKEWIHESEFETVLSGNINGHHVAINEKTGLPYGMIDGTNATNFVANKGGWNCKHALFPVADYIVPEYIRQRIEG